MKMVNIIEDLGKGLYTEQLAKKESKKDESREKELRTGKPTKRSIKK